MVGKGSVNHNSRKFLAANVDGERTHLNIEYCNKDIRETYHELFDAALEAYNAKQTRADRRIPDYYEKIRTGKQEKPFHEIILQIGNCNDTGATSEVGQIARDVLDEYYRGFQARNPNLRVFSAHLHMDEATPHIHIDFVPFITGSNRGLETRVSLKQALAAQGFRGGTRSETEWNQWAQSEKEQLAAVAERHDIEWEHLDTHEEHLSVLDYKKKERAAEVKELEERLDADHEEACKLEAKLAQLRETDAKVNGLRANLENDPDYQLPEPPPLMSAKTYMTKHVKPLFDRLKKLLLTMVVRYMELKRDYEQLVRRYNRAVSDKEQFSDRIYDLAQENRQLKKENGDYRMLRKFFGDAEIDTMLIQVWESQNKQRQQRVSHQFER
ncbi:MAG: plasmid recombination protein [Oscillospiraceae bacterium]|jgi:hypothetical protein|nr:plasmid recombination protein [Acidaminococcaceae bacterium]MBQ2140398.1 plasmid recombination protein [Acidaminococcaceae bacterium]MBQ5521897.1 plasmid recombination protein [Oscillospiraceae bacterium]